MKIEFVSYDNIDIIKSNLKSWVENFKSDSSDWLQAEFGNSLFYDTKFAEVPDFSLDISADKPFLTEAENVKRVYGNLRFLSDSQASDERLWAGIEFRMPLQIHLRNCDLFLTEVPFHRASKTRACKIPLPL